MSDLIDRQMAINEIMALIEEPDDDFNEGVRNSAVVIYQLPSAQINALDCVSRQAAIDALGEEPEVWDDDDEYGMGMRAEWCRIKKIIEKLPSANPNRKKGKWIKISPANIYECSECGKNVMTDDISAYDFCHGCGVDMRGESDE